MQHDLFIPLTARLPVVLGVFGGFLLAFDLVLVRWLTLSKVAWKRMDYVWLSLGVLGLLSAAAEVRMASASAQLDMHENRALAAFDSVKALVAVYASSPGAICRTFVRSEYSPPPDEFRKTQAEYDAACAWVKELSEALSKHAAAPPQSIVPASLPSRPNVSDGALNDMFAGLDHQFRYLDRDMASLGALRENSKRTFTEEQFVDLGPFLLAIALAIRITKVTGEIRLES